MNYFLKHVITLLIINIVLFTSPILGQVTKKTIGQHLIIGIYDYPIDQRYITFINEYQISGVIFISKNYNSTDKIKKTIQTLTSNVKHNLFFSIDQEGGDVQRIKKGIPPLPAAKEIALNYSTKQAYLLYTTTAIILNSIGININFAPVADVLTETKNTVIGSRSYSHNPFTVTSFALTAATAFENQSVLPVIKHFPGHGNTKKDSHYELPIHKNPDLFETIDLFPFSQLIKKNIPAVMVGHVQYPFLDSQKPASLSKIIVTDLLKKQLNFKGLIFSDDLAMGAIKKTTPLSNSIKQAIAAGIHQLIIIDDLATIQNTIIKITRDQEFSNRNFQQMISNINLIKEYKLRYKKF